MSATARPVFKTESLPVPDGNRSFIGGRSQLGFSVSELLALAKRLEIAAEKGQRLAAQLSAAAAREEADGPAQSAPEAAPSQIIQNNEAGLSGRGVAQVSSIDDFIERSFRREIRVQATYTEALVQEQNMRNRPQQKPEAPQGLTTATAAATLQDINIKSMRVGSIRTNRTSSAGRSRTASNAPIQPSRPLSAIASNSSRRRNSEARGSERASRLLQTQTVGSVSQDDQLFHMLHPSVTDNYIDGLINRHAPSLAQSFEQTRAYRPTFMSVDAWTANLSRGTTASGGQQQVRAYLQSLISNNDHSQEATGTSTRPRKGLTTLEIFALASHENTSCMEEACCICLDKMDVGQMVTLLPCSHGYHTSCIHRWLETCATCPLCKTVVSPFTRPETE
jgi:hypothetical protein